MKETETHKWPRTRILLVASLALNLLVVGLVAGSWLSGGDGKGKGNERHAEHSLRLGPYARAFSKEERAELRRAFEARKPWFNERRQAMRNFAKELVVVVRTAPFDPDALAELLERQNVLQTAVRAEGQTILAERLTAMTDAQRKSFADRIEQGLKRGSKR